MTNVWRWLLCILLATSMSCGCKVRNPAKHVGVNDAYFHSLRERVKYSDVDDMAATCQPRSTLIPITYDDVEQIQFWNLSLDETIHIALANSTVLRDLGGTIIRNPDTSTTILDPAITTSDPRFGVEAALAQYDTLFGTTLSYDKNDRGLNNALLGGGTQQLQQELVNFQTKVSKQSMTGGVYEFRHNIDYEMSNAPANQFEDAYTTNFELYLKQPLMQGRSTLFNRIAGPNAGPGVNNGVLIAKTNANISLADFEIKLREFVSNVENAYWDLYLAYRNFDAKRTARNASRETWDRVNADFQAQRVSSVERDQALSHYLTLEHEMEDSFVGPPRDGTRTNSGNVGGAMLSSQGVLVAERRLRQLLGVPREGFQLVRPAEDPFAGGVIFDPDASLAESMTRRIALRKQRLRIRKAEMQLWASRNHLMPKLDAFFLARARGFGDHLIGNNQPQFDGAYNDLLTGDYMEYQAGVEFQLPIGLRVAHLNVRNARLMLEREKIRMTNMQADVEFELRGGLEELTRAHRAVQRRLEIVQVSYNEVRSTQAGYEAGQYPLDRVLVAQRRFVDQESKYFRALVDHALAIKNVHHVKGSLLDYRNVHMDRQ